MGLFKSAAKNAGRNERFTALVWPHLQSVLRVARMLLKNDAEADDLTQDVMTKAFTNIDQFTGGDVKPWLYAILRNARVDRLRSTARDREMSSLDAAGVDIAGPEDRGEGLAGWDRPGEILEAFSDAQVIEALKKLPEEIRWTLLLVDVEGLDHAQAAGILSVPVGTVKSRAFRGRQMLREGLLPVARQMGVVKS